MITVTGSLAFDYIMDYKGLFADNIMADKIHKINLSFLLSDLKKQRGGTAGNIAYNLSLLKSPVSIFAAAGNDFAEYGDFLKQAGVDTSNIQIIQDKPTASAFIMTDKTDNQIIGFYPGAMEESANFSLKDLGYKHDFVIISPNDPKAIIKQSEECRELNLPFMIDMGMQLPSLLPEQIRQILKGAKILIGNDYEISLLCDKTQVTSDKLLEEVDILITTLGAKGSLIKTKSQTIEIKPGKATEVLDPTGAGDAYRAGFMAGFLKGFDLKTCGQMGSISSCFAVEKYGTTSHSFSLKEFCERYKENFGEELGLG